MVYLADPVVVHYVKRQAFLAYRFAQLQEHDTLDNENLTVLQDHLILKSLVVRTTSDGYCGVLTSSAVTKDPYGFGRGHSF